MLARPAFDDWHFIAKRQAVGKRRHCTIALSLRSSIVTARLIRPSGCSRESGQIETSPRMQRGLLRHNAVTHALAVLEVLIGGLDLLEAPNRAVVLATRIVFNVGQRVLVPTANADQVALPQHPVPLNHAPAARPNSSAAERKCIILFFAARKKSMRSFICRIVLGLREKYCAVSLQKDDATGNVARRVCATRTATLALLLWMRAKACKQALCGERITSSAFRKWCVSALLRTVRRLACRASRPGWL